MSQPSALEINQESEIGACILHWKAGNKAAFGGAALLASLTFMPQVLMFFL